MALPVFPDPTNHVCDVDWNLGESPCCGDGDGNVIDVRGMSYRFRGLRRGHVPIRGSLYSSCYHPYLGWTTSVERVLTVNGQAPNPVLAAGFWSDTGVFLRGFTDEEYTYRLIYN